MTVRWSPHGPSSRAVLIGTGRFTDDGLPHLPAVEANIRSLRAALTHPTLGLLVPEHCRLVSDPTDQKSVGAALSWAAREADDLLLVYYAGHGVLDGDGVLHLALVHTDTANAGFTAVPIDLVKRIVGQARARSRVLLVDCCFSGRAGSAMAEPTNLAVGQLDWSGTYTLTATTRNEPAHAPEGATHTAFTGALLQALAAAPPRTLDEVYFAVHRELTGRALPPPQRWSAGAAGSLVLMRGPVGTPAAPPPPPSAHPHPAPPPPPTVSAVPPATGRRGRRRVMAAAVAGALTVVLASAFAVWAIRTASLAASGAHGSQSATTTRSAAPPPASPSPESPTSPTSSAPGPSPAAAGPKVRYRDKALTLRTSCTVKTVQLLDLDKPAATTIASDALAYTADAEIGYGACPGVLALNSDNPRVKAGLAPPDTHTADGCRTAAERSPLPQTVEAARISPGLVWCVITTENRVAKLTFTKVRPAAGGDPASTSAPGPDLELTATLWDAP
ncbi:caspase domain-containing protein [Streptomyces sp. NPDC057743]|uniref:caspase family protein n=1 Tax=Streptomyces sp. NPDC057743 TaxID=3346236 RepID=UPI0036CE8063